MFYYQIIPALNELNYFLYSSDVELIAGQIVCIEVKNKKVFGVVYKKGELQDFVVKPILFSTKLIIDLKLIFFLAKEYYEKFGSCFKMILPVKSFLFENTLYTVGKSTRIKLYDYSESHFYDINRLSNLQLQAREEILNTKLPTLLFGVTGSGKTEVFLSLINNIKGQVLILIPEINLANTLFDRLAKQYNIFAKHWHSELSDSSRSKLYSEIICGKVKIVIGTRSAIFLPFLNLELIIIDESHDASFKQSTKVLYNAKDIAMFYHEKRNVKLVLSSATPSLEDFFLTQNNKMKLVQLPTRHFSDMPNISVQKIWNKILSDELDQKIRNTISQNKQVLLFCSHRGYARYLLCKECMYSQECDNCSVYLSVFGNTLRCKYCDLKKPITTECLKCKSKEIALVGFGIERVYEYLLEYYKEYKIDYVVSDLLNASEKIEKFYKGEIDILVGTQIIAKGYNFPKLSLVGILNVDLGFLSGDMRSAESNFQVLSQVAGRSGRFEKGEVVIQTYGTKDKFIDYLVKNDYLGFARSEINSRGKFGPSNFIAQMIFISRNEEVLRNEVFRIVKNLPNAIGPARAQIYKNNQFYRYVILFISNKKIYFNIEKMQIDNRVILKIDINPYNYL